MQQFLKSAGRAAGAEVVATQFFEEFFVLSDDADGTAGAFDAGLGREAALTFAGGFETRIGFGGRWFS